MSAMRLLAAILSIGAGVCGSVGLAVADTVEVKSAVVPNLRVEIDRARLAEGFEYTFTLSNTCEVNRDASRPGAAKLDGAIGILRVPKDGPVTYREPRVHQFRNRTGLVANFRRDGAGYSYQVGEHHTKLGTWHSRIEHIAEQDGAFHSVMRHAASNSLPHDITVHDRQLVDGVGLVLLRHVEEAVGPTRVIGSAIDVVDPVTGALRWRWVSNVDAEFPGGEVSSTGVAKQYFHANSIIFHPGRSAFLVSARGMSTIYEISYPEGRVRNRINCKSWTCLNDPYGGFLRQHDAVLSDDGATLTLFDNANQIGERIRPSRALSYKISFETRTLTFDKAWSASNPYPYRYLQGGYHQLADGSAVVGWGAVDGRTCGEIAKSGASEMDHLFSHLGGDGKAIVAVRVPPGWSTYRAYGYALK